VSYMPLVLIGSSTKEVKLATSIDRKAATCKEETH